ncbi:putative quinol monooxygenase [Flavisericum labens]|uniref:putative quinol monooxygenase n=1 Tax=Flavisericum labens TaxID=3377112 RepID=UPI00387A8E90
MENTQVFWNLELSIKHGKLEALKALIDGMILATKANEPDTINYEWSINLENSECHIFERYTNSDAVRTHLGNFQAYAERFFDCLDVQRFHVYGNPDSELISALAGLGAVHLKLFDGFSR